MELFELYGIIGNAIMIIVEFGLLYFSVKLVYKFFTIVYDNNSRFNKICEEQFKREHHKKHLKRWLRSDELQAKYNDFYDYYAIQYSKRYKYSIAYNDFVKHMEVVNHGEKQSIE